VVRFARFAKKLVNVPKREIDEKAKEWQTRRTARAGRTGRTRTPCDSGSSGKVAPALWALWLPHVKGEPEHVLR
jgi:predicted AAA+ superfamily ATPase